MKFVHIFLYVISLCSSLCFGAWGPDTQIVTPQGLVAISQLKVGDQVVSINDIGDGFGLTTIEAITTYTSQACYQLTLGKEVLYASPDQRMFDSVHGDFVAVVDLISGQSCVLCSFDLDPSSSMEFVEESMQVYDLTLAAPHVFFVSSNFLLAHNVPFCISASIGIVFGAGSAVFTAGASLVIGGVALGLSKILESKKQDARELDRRVCELKTQQALQAQGINIEQEKPQGCFSTKPNNASYTMLPQPMHDGEKGLACVRPEERCLPLILAQPMEQQSIFDGITCSVSLDVDEQEAAYPSQTNLDSLNVNNHYHNIDVRIDELLKAGNALDKGGLTSAGRALQKHGSRANSVFPAATGNINAINAQGEAVLKEILTHSNVTSMTRHHARFGHILEFRILDGKGVRFSSDGKTFIGFIEP